MSLPGMEKFDKAAEEAKKEFEKLEEKFPGAFDELADWWKKWRSTAGHKRLGRILLHEF